MEKESKFSNYKNNNNNSYNGDSDINDDDDNDLSEVDTYSLSQSPSSINQRFNGLNKSPSSFKSPLPPKSSFRSPLPPKYLVSPTLSLSKQKTVLPSPSYMKPPLSSHPSLHPSPHPSQQRPLRLNPSPQPSPHPSRIHDRINFRDGSHYDIITREPTILTIEVGDEPSSPDTKKVKLVSEYDHLLKPKELDHLLTQYSQESDKHYKPHVIQQDESFSIEKAEKEKEKWIIKLNDAFQYLLEYTKEEAKKHMKHLLGPYACDMTDISLTSNSTLDDSIIPNSHFVNSHSQQSNLVQSFSLDYLSIIKYLDTETFPIHEWKRTLIQIQTNIKSMESKEQEIKKTLQEDILKEKDTSVGVHMALALDQLLDKRKQWFQKDFEITRNTYVNHNYLLNKTSVSYITFHSWIMEHWNRKLKNLQSVHEKISNKMRGSFENDSTYKDIRQLLEEYEKFLTFYENYLPMEFTLSANPRKTWKELMVEDQPDECIRLMKNELRSLENIPNLKKSIDVWQTKLNHYDVQQLKKVSENKKTLKKRIEYAIKEETRQTCQKGWTEFLNRIYQLGLDIQKETTKRVIQYNQTYETQHYTILDQNQQIQREILALEARLSMIDKPWAQWLEKRKFFIKDWIQLNYWEVSIHNLLETFQVILNFKTHLEKNI